MIEGIVVCALLIAGLFLVHWLFNKMASPSTDVPHAPVAVPMPPVKAPREEAQRYERKREAVAKAPVERKPAASTKYSYPYGQSGGSSAIDTHHGESALLGVVAAVVATEVFYEPTVDTTPAYEYTSPTPSSYCEQSSSSWGGDSSSSSSYDSGSSSSYSSGSCD